ncbi:hypothetical protein A2454_00370 [Candidatus Peribacteria bacterium RIFOXYC2_FULL_55_14]|nr:MAG: hypothetical protein UY87_C0007G0020 [Candidatus Peribacteria bacterium GW2011_GWC2_54_8]KKW41577.1 MAG: hypothetical protein UY90_C0049G0002 [Candidatus Peregrinibacteria bacterium GW2011_GWA2_54_9]OGJ73129.1 MAG: hypothetical protein A2198_03160 [Candidatus Peribacteria bacterium RIFOXYA1_FULL_56_14]OGJ73898.1 MAG: hypothetical protein A2217_04135 [Candidatus Peribacteria bacterium RIFOXYA2_FULL_55_28]OGJ75741.1 MAG: hypothetical protein A2384_05605 [Candidatus Peribacteria bacterium 
MQQEQLPETVRPEKRCGRRTALLRIVFGCAYASTLGGCGGHGLPDPVQQRVEDEEPYMKKAWWQQQGMEREWSGIFFRLSKMGWDGTLDSRRFTQEQWDSNERIAGWMQENHIVDIMVWNDREHTEFNIYVTFESLGASDEVTDDALMQFAYNVAKERYPWQTYSSEWKGSIEPVSGGRNRRKVELRYEHDPSLDPQDTSE